MSNLGVKEGFLPIINMNDVPCVLIPTTSGIKYSDSATLEEALLSMKEQIIASASLVSSLQNEVNAMRTWLNDNFGADLEEGVTDTQTYLVPMFAELEQVATVSGNTPEENSLEENNLGEGNI